MGKRIKRLLGTKGDVQYNYTLIQYVHSYILYILIHIRKTSLLGGVLGYVVVVVVVYIVHSA